MSGPPNLGESSRPYTSNHDGSSVTSWPDSEAPVQWHDPTSYVYPTHFDQQQQQRGQSQDVTNKPDLYEEQESYDESDGGDLLAHGPPQPHQMHYPKNQYQHQQYRSQHEHLYAARLHDLVAAAGLSTSAPPPLSDFSSIPELSATTNLHNLHAHDHRNHHHLPEISSIEYEPGPNSYSMHPMPFSPGILNPHHMPSLNSITYSRTSPREPVQVDLPGPMDSYNFVLSSVRLKRVPSDANAPAIDICSRSSPGSPTSTQEDEEDSPYAEVRASVSNMDDPEMPTTTFRMWFLGLILVLGGSCLNTFFHFRYPAPSLTPPLVLLIAYPLGKALAYTLPTRTWVLPWIPGGWKFTLNPGPFNVKEHVLIYMMANVAIAPAYVMNAIVVAEQYYGRDFGPGFEILLTLATTITGFGLSGVYRRFLVWPTNLIWPQNLVSCTVLNTFHEEDRPGWNTNTSLYRFFLYAMTGVFLWTFFPGFLFLGLSFFSWACWIAPSGLFFLRFGDRMTDERHPTNDLVINQLFGTVSGLGMGIITFDWAQIAYIGSPLMVPWWAEAHVFAGFVLIYWVILPILYYTNVSLLPSFPTLPCRALTNGRPGTSHICL